MTVPGVDTTERQIVFEYRLGRAQFRLDVSAALPMSGITGVFGPSGAGKTSLLRCIAGLERAAHGRLVVAGEDWEDSARGLSLPPHRREIGYVFQEPRLFPHLDVAGNLDYGRRRANGASVSTDEIVELLGIGHLMTRRPHTLSGGEAQRVAIARALLRSPRLLLLDEPLASLDEPRKQEVLPYLDRLHAQLATPVVYVSHNVDEVVRLCDHLVVLRGGGIVASGPIQQVLAGIEPPPLGDGISALDGEVAGYDSDYDLARVTLSGAEFHVSGRHAVGSRLRLTIRASDVSLCRERPAGTTILNIVPAVIEAIADRDAATALVRLRLGNDRIVATVTRRSIAELRLAAGDELYAQIKSVAVRSAGV